AVVRRFITTGTDKLGYSPAPDPDDEHETVIGPGGMVTGDGIPEVLGASPGMDGQDRLRAQLESDDTYLGAGGRFTTGPEAADDEGAIGVSGAPPRPNGAPSAQAGTSNDGLGASRTRRGSLGLVTGRLTVEVDVEEVHLTPTELRVLLLLTEQPEHVYSREKIAFTAWGYEWAGDSRVVDDH